MIGATGAVGGHVVDTLLGLDSMDAITLLGRRTVPQQNGGGASTTQRRDRVSQHVVDLAAPDSYAELLDGHDVAICTLGVGAPTTVTKEQFTAIDRDIPLAFARTCAARGVRHFELLSSVGADATSRSFYLRSKGELENELQSLGFERLSLFHPSMILTPTNRYGVSQAITLAVWPKLRPMFFGPLRKFRGIAVDVLGRAMARNIVSDGSGIEILEWDAFQSLAESAEDRHHP